MSRKRRLYVGLVALAMAAAFGMELRAGLLEIEGPEMEPGLRAGDVVWVNRWAYVLSAPERGDVVRLAFEGVDAPFVRRIVGLPGERVDFVAGQLAVGGEPAEVTAIPGEIAVRERIGAASYRVLEPPGAAPPPREYRSFASDREQYFVLADRRGGSKDSRLWGSVERDEIVGRVVAVWRVDTGALRCIDEN